MASLSLKVKEMIYISLFYTLKMIEYCKNVNPFKSIYKFNAILIKSIVEFNEHNKHMLTFILKNKGLNYRLINLNKEK